MHKLHLVGFLGIFLTIYLGMHFYVFHRFASGLMLAGSARTLVKLLFVLGGLSFFVVELLSRRVDSMYFKPLFYFGMVWLGTLSMGLAVCVLRDLLLVVFRTPAFNYYSALSGLCLLGLMTTASVANVALGRTIKEVRIAIPKLPKELAGFSIVQLSDVHINSLSSGKWIKEVVTQTNALQPDLVVVTGDLIDADICRFDDFCATLRGLRSKYGTYAIIGNHEYYTGLNVFADVAARTNMTPLRNRAVSVADGAIQLVGIDDDLSAMGPRAEGELRRITANVDFSKPVVLLAHRPDVFDTARRIGVDLQLSGHVHAGQIPPLDLIVQFIFKYPQGLYRRDGAYVYTTTGTGYWGPPMRLFSRSEIVKFVLEPA